MKFKYTEEAPTVVVDTECYLNYWSIAFKCPKTGRMRSFRRTRNEELNRPAVAKILRNNRVISFNGIGYDMPMIAYAMSGATNGQLKQLSDDIIVGGLRPWHVEDKYGVSLPDWIDHIDLMEASPGSPTKPSLKIYAGRLHSRKMQDLPFEPDRTLSHSDIAVLENYHENDLDVTVDFQDELASQLALRAVMSEQYGVDLRSKSDAQIAEAVIKVEIERATGRRVYRPEIRSGVFHYAAPSFVTFETPTMRAVFDRVLNAKFVVGHDGVVRMPPELKDPKDGKKGIPVLLGNSTYRMGIGGLHSCEKSVTHLADADTLLIDRDVTSYYPNIILLTGLYPKHLGPKFLDVYRKIYHRRLDAKRRGDMDTSETLKIVLNGSFGKFGSPYSALYSPDLMIQTTIGGQLAILMMIERMYLSGFDVVSANTDGFVTKVPVSTLDDFNAIVWDWEADTELMTEETRYSALHSRDVNNYLAIQTNGKVKTKGAFAPAGRGQKGAAGLKKNPACEIAIEAAVAYLKDGKSISETIESCTDIRKFLAVRRVNGGAEKDGVLIGKAIRYYYAEGERGTINYVTNGNTVPRTEGAKPLMELTGEFPDDVDIDWYEREAFAILEDVGMGVADPALAGRTGRAFARLPAQKNLHIMDLSTGRAICGKSRDSIRTTWVEYATIPDGHRLCSKCKKKDEL